MRVDRERRANVGVPEDILGALRRYTRLGHQRAGEVAHVMEAQRGQAGLPSRRLMLNEDSLAIEVDRIPHEPAYLA